MGISKNLTYMKRQWVNMKKLEGLDSNPTENHVLFLNLDNDVGPIVCCKLLSLTDAM